LIYILHKSLKNQANLLFPINNNVYICEIKIKCFRYLDARLGIIHKEMFTVVHDHILKKLAPALAFGIQTKQIVSHLG